MVEVKAVFCSECITVYFLHYVMCTHPENMSVVYSDTWELRAVSLLYVHPTAFMFVGVGDKFSGFTLSLQCS
jgi:hypothetical protein